MESLEEGIGLTIAVTPPDVADNLSSILEYENGKVSTVLIYNPSTCVSVILDGEGSQLPTDCHCFSSIYVIR